MISFEWRFLVLTHYSRCGPRRGDYARAMPSLLILGLVLLIVTFKGRSTIQLRPTPRW